MKSIFIIILISISVSLYSQFKISGTLRPRAEFRNGYKTLRDSDSEMAGFVGQRTRLLFDYKKEKLTTRITLYDFRVWGDQNLKSDLPSMGLLEAWAEINLSDKFSLKAGRQTLKYDNNRLISPVNWNQIGASHDALLFKFRKSDWIIDLGLAFNQNSQNTFGTDYPAQTNNYKTLNFLWINRQFGKLNLAALNLTDGHQKDNEPNTIYLRTTNGIVIKYKLDKIELQNRSFYQNGKTKIGQDISAWYKKTDLISSINKKLKLTFGTEIMSGNNAENDQHDKFNAFDIVIGGRHKFNGKMDYYSVPSTTHNAGLIDPYIIIDYKINDKITISPEYHYFMLQNNYVVDNNTVDNFLGHEIDLTLNFNISEEIDLQAGYSVMFASETAEIIKGGDKDLFNNWAFVMLIVKPTFFESK